MTPPYVHGYDRGRASACRTRPGTLVDLLHADTAYPDGSLVLEAGCGVGAQTVTLARRSPGAQFMSVDVSADSLAEARRRVDGPGSPTSRSRRPTSSPCPSPSGRSTTSSSASSSSTSPRPVEALARLRGLLAARRHDHRDRGRPRIDLLPPRQRRGPRAIECQVELQRAAGGDALIGRRLYPLMVEAGLEGVRVSPRMVYVDASRPGLVDGFTRKTFTAMIEGVREPALAAGLIDAERFDAGHPRPAPDDRGGRRLLLHVLQGHGARVALPDGRRAGSATDRRERRGDGRAASAGRDPRARRFRARAAAPAHRRQQRGRRPARPQGEARPAGTAAARRRLERGAAGGRRHAPHPRERRDRRLPVRGRPDRPDHRVRRGPRGRPRPARARRHRQARHPPVLPRHGERGLSRADRRRRGPGQGRHRPRRRDRPHPAADERRRRQAGRRPPAGRQPGELLHRRPRRVRERSAQARHPGLPGADAEAGRQARTRPDHRLRPQRRRPGRVRGDEEARAARDRGGVVRKPAADAVRRHQRHAGARRGRRLGRAGARHRREVPRRVLATARPAQAPPPQADEHVHRRRPLRRAQQHRRLRGRQRERGSHLRGARAARQDQGLDRRAQGRPRVRRRAARAVRRRRPGLGRAREHGRDRQDTRGGEGEAARRTVRADRRVPEGRRPRLQGRRQPREGPEEALPQAGPRARRAHGAARGRLERPAVRELAGQVQGRGPPARLVEGALPQARAALQGARHRPAAQMGAREHHVGHVLRLHHAGARRPQEGARGGRGRAHQAGSHEEVVRQLLGVQPAHDVEGRMEQPRRRPRGRHRRRHQPALHRPAPEEGHQRADRDGHHRREDRLRAARRR